MKRQIIKRLNKRQVLLAVALILFVGLGLSSITSANNKVQLKNIELKDTSTDLKQLELKYDNLNIELDKVDKTKTEDIKRLEGEKLKLENEKRELEKQVTAKREAQRIAQERANKPAQAVSKVVAPKASAAPATGVSGGCAGIRAKLARLGVPANQLDSAIRLAIRESSCNEYAVNRNGGACGAFQSLPCGKWGSPGTDSYYRGAIAYANSRYNGYNGALAFSLRNNWY